MDFAALGFEVRADRACGQDRELATATFSNAAVGGRVDPRDPATNICRGCDDRAYMARRVAARVAIV